MGNIAVNTGRSPSVLISSVQTVVFLGPFKLTKPMKDHYNGPAGSATQSLTQWHFTLLGSLPLKNASDGPSLRQKPPGAASV